MTLVNYASSDEDKDENNIGLSPKPESPSAGPKGLKRKREINPNDTSELPPLPSKFHDLYASTTRVSTRDDSSLHGGRKRITPHIEGSWPTHLYIEWYPSIAEHGLLTSIIRSIQEAGVTRIGEEEIKSLLISDLGAPLPLHVSMSRPIVFTATQKESFAYSLHENIAGCGVRPFELKFEDLDWVPNFEKTRWFLVLRLQKPEGDGLNRLLAVCNGTVEEYSQPPLYAASRLEGQRSPKVSKRQKWHGRDNIGASPKNDGTLDFSSAFHISIAWAFEQPSSFLMRNTKTSINNDVFEPLKRVSITVDALKVKIGNIVKSISLPLKAADGKGIFGV